jgi:hypothetical protein
MKAEDERGFPAMAQNHAVPCEREHLVVSDCECISYTARSRSPEKTTRYTFPGNLPQRRVIHLEGVGDVVEPGPTHFVV